jgi:hypothetical protein
MTYPKVSKVSLVALEAVYTCSLGDASDDRIEQTDNRVLQYGNPFSLEQRCMVSFISKVLEDLNKPETTPGHPWFLNSFCLS